MGCCLPCLVDDYEPVTPTAEQRRQTAAAAADKRIQEQQARGVQNPESVRKLQRQAEARQIKAEQTPPGQGLKWQVG